MRTYVNGGGNSFRIRTYGLLDLKSFRMRTYENDGRGVGTHAERAHQKTAEGMHTNTFRMIYLHHRKRQVPCNDILSKKGWGEGSDGALPCQTPPHRGMATPAGGPVERPRGTTP